MGDKDSKKHISHKENEKQKILFVTPYFPPHSGGLERYVSEITCGIEKEDWDVHILTTNNRKKIEYEKVEGCSVIRIPVTFTTSNTPFSFAWFFQIPKILKHIQPSLVNVHMPVPGIGDLVSLFLPRRIPLVLTYHGLSMKKGAFVTDMIIWLYEHGPLILLLRKARYIICSSDAIRLEFLKRYKHKSSTIMPGVDTNAFYPSQEKKSNQPTVLFVAGLGKGEEHKGLETLLHIFVEVKKNIKNAQLRVVGDGNKKGYYEELTKNLGLHDVVTFTGKLHGKELLSEYQKSHIFALPTQNESFGMVIAEAMASGLPVVSNAVGGVPHLVEDGKTGILLEPNDKEGFTKGLIMLLGNLPKAFSFGVAGREKISKGFTWSERVHATEKVYRDIISNKRPIIHITGYYPPHVGGMEVVAHELALEQARRGYTVKVLTSTIGAKQSDRIEKKTNYTLLRLTSMECAHTPIMWTLPLRLFFLPKKSILHIHLAQVLIPEIVLFVARMRKMKVIAHYHLDVEPSGRLGWLFVWYKNHILGFVLRHMDAVMVASSEQKRVVVEKYNVSPEKILQIKNAVHSMFFQKHVKNVPHTPFRILAVGRLTNQKRMDRIIEAMSYINIPAELIVIGEGEERENLEHLISKLKLTTVQLLGTKTHEEITKYHAWADVFVIPSEKEGGMPLVALEAMAARLPVIGSNLSGIRDLLEGVGILVDPVTPEKFSEVLSALYHNPDEIKELSEKSYTTASEYTWAEATSRIEDVYSFVTSQE